MGMSGSIVLAADDPAALAGRRQPGRLALCLQRQTEDSSAVAVLNDWIYAALTLGASLQDPARQESFGAEVLRGRSLAAGPGGQPPAAAGAARAVKPPS